MHRWDVTGLKNQASKAAALELGHSNGPSGNMKEAGFEFLMRSDSRGSFQSICFAFVFSQKKKSFSVVEGSVP